MRSKDDTDSTDATTRLTRMKPFLTFLVGWSTALLLSACPGPAPGPVLGFTDPDGSPEGILFPLAKGRSTRLEVTLLSPLSQRTEVGRATSSNERVLRVKDVKESVVTIDALDVGQASLRVAMKSGLEDSIDLEVREEGAAWFLSAAGDLANAVNATGSYNVAVNDALVFDRFFYADVEGRRLSGVGPLPFGAVESTGKMSVETSATALVVRAGEPGDEVSLATPHGKIRFRTVDGLNVADLAAFVHEVPYPRHVRTGASFELPPDGYVIRFLAVDDDGYAYVGGHPLDMSVETGDAQAFGLTSAREESRCASRGADGDCVRYEGLRHGVFDFTALPSTNETASFNVTVGSVTRTFEVTARFASAQ